MIFGILAIIAMWVNDIPLAWQVTITVFASLHIFVELAGVVVKAYQASN